MRQQPGHRLVWAVEPPRLSRQAAATAVSPMFEVTNVNGSHSTYKAPVTATAGGGTTTYDGTTKSPSACLVTGVYKGDLQHAPNNPASVGPGFGNRPRLSR